MVQTATTIGTATSYEQRGVAAERMMRAMRDFVSADATDEQIVNTLEVLAHTASTQRSFMAGIRAIEPEATRNLRAERWLYLALRRVTGGINAARQGQVQLHERWRTSKDYRGASSTDRPEAFVGPYVDGKEFIVTLARNVDGMQVSGRYMGAQQAFRAVLELMQQALRGA
jgi:hypothetical protein